MKFLVGLSGGADSAAVALSLLEAGHEVVAVFLRLFEGSDDSAARFVAQKLEIPLETIDAVEAFEACVVENFVSEYARGRTPNPCALCNREIKIRLLCEAAAKFGCDKVATGHYAAVLEEDGRFFVREGADRSRDQSYFLWRLTQEELGRLTLVLSDRRKAELGERVRALLPEGVRESREVCFVPEDDRVAFLEARLAEKECLSGDFVDVAGRVLARHNGIFRYTVGQRRGFGVGFGKRVYVRAIEPETRRVILSDKERCEGTEAFLSALNFQKRQPGDGTFEVLCRVRYRAPLLPARLTVEGERAHLVLQQGHRAVFAPGQSAVCYDEAANVLCGGIIEPETGKNEIS